MPSVRAMHHHVAMVTNDLDATKRFYWVTHGRQKSWVEGHPFHGATGQCFIALGEGLTLEFFEFPTSRHRTGPQCFDDKMPKAGRLL
ncbi:MAG: hypothetical protein R2849_08575 [Thermomicrobiales bacterium]